MMATAPLDPLVWPCIPLLRSNPSKRILYRGVSSPIRLHLRTNTLLSCDILLPVTVCALSQRKLHGAVSPIARLHSSGAEDGTGDSVIELTPGGTGILMLKGKETKKGAITLARVIDPDCHRSCCYTAQVGRTKSATQGFNGGILVMVRISVITAWQGQGDRSLDCSEMNICITSNKGSKGDENQQVNVSHPLHSPDKWIWVAHYMSFPEVLQKSSCCLLIAETHSNIHRQLAHCSLHSPPYPILSSCSLRDTQ